MQQSDIQTGLISGGRVQGAFIVERRFPSYSEYVVYLRASWTRGFHALQTYRQRSDRIYIDLDRLLRLIRSEFEFTGPVTLYTAGDPALQRFKAVSHQDAGRMTPLLSE